MPRYVPIIGLEIHVRLKTQSKMFCRCANVPEDTLPNTAICPICTGHPGTLPVVNAEAVRLGVRAGLALNCTVPDTAHFDRKHYFYPDLPKGYQISQFDFPITINGSMTIDVPAEDKTVHERTIRITRAHLEEDAAKNIHDSASNATLVDYNRGGVPLLEIVTEPDLRSPAEARLFLQELQTMMRSIRVSEADMEKGYMRCDANISLMPVDNDNLPLQHTYNPKVEIKNMNSFRNVERALKAEIERQTALYEQGKTVESATRGFDDATGKTLEQRSKETGADYRYFPEPDLPPLNLVSIREEESHALPELPRTARKRLADEWGFTEEGSAFLVANDGWADYAERVMSELSTWTEKNRSSEEEKQRLARLTGSWLTNKLAYFLAQQQKSIRNLAIDPENFAEFIHLVDKGVVNSTNAQKLLLFMMEKGADPSHILEEQNLGQADDPQMIAEIVARTIEQNPTQAAQVRSGKQAVLKWFVGQVMKATEGRANPEQAEEALRKQLGV